VKTIFYLDDADRSDMSLRSDICAWKSFHKDLNDLWSIGLTHFLRFYTNEVFKVVKGKKGSESIPEI